MATQEITIITVENTVNAPLAKVWDYWTQPEHITQWNHASDDWHSPWAKNDLRPGGSFSARMEAKDGSFGFDFGGVYDAVILHEYIEYTLGDGRKVKITFSAGGNITRVTESFEAEGTNPVEMQQRGWQAILDNFKRYTEAGN
ncbi:MAG: SRPBCC family protein [Chitinophagaceae bacterium]|nr:SRPBCC family protein [Chitinophagaceae bacterium]